MKTSKTGYKINSKDNQEKKLRIPSPNITMENVPHPVIGIGEQSGQQQIMYPGFNYYFPSDQSVVETAVMQIGGQYPDLGGRNMLLPEPDTFYNPFLIGNSGKFSPMGSEPTPTIFDPFGPQGADPNKDISKLALGKVNQDPQQNNINNNSVPYGAISAGFRIAGALGNGIYAHQKEKSLRKFFSPESTNTFYGSDRGDYDVNTGRFRPDQHVPVQFAGYQVGGDIGNFSYDAHLIGSVPKMHITRSAPVQQIQQEDDAVSQDFSQSNSVIDHTGHNNPGNIMYVPSFAKKYGAQPGRNDTGHKVAIFPTMETGLSAMNDLLFGPGYLNLTVKEARNKWVTGNPNKNADNIQGFIQEVGTSGKLKDLSSEDRKKVLSAFIKWEDVDVYKNLKKSGILQYEEGGEYDLSDEEIKQILKNGGEIEYI